MKIFFASTAVLLVICEGSNAFRVPLRHVHTDGPFNGGTNQQPSVQTPPQPSINAANPNDPNQVNPFGAIPLNLPPGYLNEYGDLIKPFLNNIPYLFNNPFLNIIPYLQQQQPFFGLGNASPSGVPPFLSYLPATPYGYNPTSLHTFNPNTAYPNTYVNNLASATAPGSSNNSGMRLKSVAQSNDKEATKSKDHSQSESLPTEKSSTIA